MEVKVLHTIINKSTAEICSFALMLFLATDTLGTRYTFVNMKFLSIILCLSLEIAEIYGPPTLYATRDAQAGRRPKATRGSNSISSHDLKFKSSPGTLSLGLVNGINGFVRSRCSSVP